MYFLSGLYLNRSCHSMTKINVKFCQQSTVQTYLYRNKSNSSSMHTL